MSAVYPTLAPLAPQVDVTHWRGHRLPLRLEINGDRKIADGLESVVWWWTLLDEDHRVVEPQILDFDQARQLMEQANSTMIRHSRGYVIDEKIGGICHRRVGLHPVRGYHARTQLAFDCLMLFPHGTPVDWIDPELRDAVRHVGVYNRHGVIDRRWIELWWEWRAHENEAERRAKMQ